MATENEIEQMSEEGNERSIHVEKLLVLAERFQEKCELHERRIWFMGFVSAFFVFACLGLATYWFATYQSPTDRVFNSGFLVYTIMFAFSVVYYLTRYHRFLRRDRRALFSIVDMLREFESALVKRNQMSMLERAEFRIRLSRFDIGPGRSS